MIWRITLSDGSKRSADMVECVGGALILSKLHPGHQISTLAYLAPGWWKSAERVDVK